MEKNIRTWFLNTLFLIWKFCWCVITRWKPNQSKGPENLLVWVTMAKKLWKSMTTIQRWCRSEKRLRKSRICIEYVHDNKQEDLIGIRRLRKLRKIVQIPSWIQRFVHNARNPQSKKFGPLSLLLLRTEQKKILD